jgi:hypothetical protein
MRDCSLYRRAAGYFSSSALITWASASPRLAQLGNFTIQVIASPQLTQEDIDALHNLQDAQERHEYESIIVNRILDDIVRFAEEPSDNQLCARIFCWLIANQRLVIRFAFAKHVTYPGIFHGKIGIFDFPSRNRVAFTGSANETLSGHERNYESIDVYRSWVDAELERVSTKVDQFQEDRGTASGRAGRMGFQ